MDFFCGMGMGQVWRGMDLRLTPTNCSGRARPSVLVVSRPAFIQMAATQFGRHMDWEIIAKGSNSVFRITIREGVQRTQVQNSAYDRKVIVLSVLHPITPHNMRLCITTPHTQDTWQYNCNYSQTIFMHAYHFIFYSTLRITLLTNINLKSTGLCYQCLHHNQQQLSKLRKSSVNLQQKNTR